MEVNNEPTEQATRREIAANEKSTIEETNKIFDLMALSIFALPLVKIYISRAIASPISDTTSLIALSKSIDEVIKNTLNQLYTTIHTRTVFSWTLGEKLSIASLNGRIPLNVLKSLKLKEAASVAHREKIMYEFIDRKTKGLNLSARVWSLEKGIKTQIETVLQLSVYEGKSASEIANELKKYLKNPDQLFRKVRDAAGNLVLSKAAKQFRPGIGVYKSPYANAFRLARNETNKSYRRAAWEKIQGFDFVTGQRIELSNNHPVKDICDSLSGIYPKSFCWSGFHVQCRCHMITELVSMENIVKMQQGTFTPVQTTEYPVMFRQWILENKARIKPDSGIDWIDDTPEVRAMFLKRTNV